MSLTPKNRYPFSLLSRKLLFAASCLPGLFSILSATVTADHSLEKVDYRVINFGATPDSDSDAGPAILAAIEASADAQGPVRILFPRGTLKIGPESVDRTFLSIRNRNDLTLEGDETLLVLMDSPRATALLIENCHNITVRGIAIDFDPLPYTQGRVRTIAPEAGTFDLVIDRGYLPLSDSDMFSVGSTMGYVYTEDGRFKKTADKIWQADVRDWMEHESGVYRVTVNPRKIGDTIGVGDRIALKDRGGVTINIRNSQNVLFENVRVFAAGGIGIAGHKTDGLHFRQVAIIPRPGTDRLFSVNNAAIRVDSARRGPVIENSIFMNTGDDTLVLAGYPAQILEVISDTELVAAHRNFRLSEGDSVEVWGSDRGVIRGIARVERVQQRGNRFTITLENPIEGMTNGDDGRPADRISNRATMMQGTVIRHNIGRNLPRMFVGIFGADDVLIEDNQVEWLQGAAISMRGSRFGAVGVSRNITIKNNRFESAFAPYSNSFGAFAIYCVLPSGRGDTGAESRAHENIHILGNEFIDQGRGAMWIANANGVNIIGNRVVAHATTHSYDGTARAIWLQNSDNIRIDDFELIDPRPDIEAGIYIESDVGSVEIGNVKFSVDRRIRSNQSEVIDLR
jgi:hypothetical protein